MNDLQKRNQKITMSRMKRLKQAHRPMVTHIKGLNIKKINRQLDHIFKAGDPVAQEFLAHGPIRLKKSWLVYLKRDHQLNLKYGDSTAIANDLKIIHQIKTRISGKYIFILHRHYHDATSLDFAPLKVSLRHVRSIRRKQFKNAVAHFLNDKDIATLKFALSPAQAPKGCKTEYSRLSGLLTK